MLEDQEDVIIGEECERYFREIGKVQTKPRREHVQNLQGYTNSMMIAQIYVGGCRKKEAMKDVFHGRVCPEGNRMMK